MDKNPRLRLARRTIFAKGVANTLLGIVHIVGTFTFEASNIASKGTPELRRDYLVWFFGVGVFILFTGIVDLLCARELEAGNLLAWKTGLASATFVALAGTCGVSIFGISPPLQLLLTGIVGVVVLAASRKEFLVR